jgi:hypothetical protein
LYFGSAYEKTPARFSIKPLPVYKPRFLSVGDQYETDAMSRRGLRKVRNMWALANEQLERDVYYKQRIFEVLDFLLQNREDLEEEPAFYAYGALAASAIEEFDLLAGFLEGYAALQSSGNSDMEELISSLSFFREVDEPAGPMDRIIFDSRSWIQGVPFTGISGKYWDVLLGRGLLLPSFEQGFLGVRQGEEATFRFVFPDDYVQEELRGQEVEVQAKIHKVFKSVEAHGVDEVKSLGIRNRYAFENLDLLREQNEILYYLSLRDADQEALLRTPSHFLMLVHCLAKLGKREQVQGLSSMLKGKAPALNALADTVSAAGKCAWAVEYYEAISNELPSSTLKIVRCLLNSGQSVEAMNLLRTMPEATSLEFQETLLECLKAADPESDRIPSLEHHVLDLRVTATLGREAVSRSSQLSGPPIVHGLSDNDASEA